MEIKFFDKKKNEYVDDEVFYIDESMGVYTFRVNQYENFLQEYGYIEPHFYLNGERIA